MPDIATKQELLQGLIQIGAMKFNFKEPYTYASGLKGPIYCDNRKILGHPRLRGAFISHLSTQIAVNGCQFQAIAGLATAGIPHAAWLADRLELPMMYIRSKPKEHGKGQQLEGDPLSGQKVLVVEDLINQASSLENAMQVLKTSGMIVTGIACLVSYDMPVAKQKISDWEIPLMATLGFHDIILALQQNQILTNEELAQLKKWQQYPDKWC